MEGRGCLEAPGTLAAFGQRGCLTGLVAVAEPSGPSAWGALSRPPERPPHSLGRHCPTLPMRPALLQGGSVSLGSRMSSPGENSLILGPYVGTSPETEFMPALQALWTV